MKNFSAVTAYTKQAQRLQLESTTVPNTSAEDSPMSISDLRKMLLLLQEIQVKTGKCARKMKIPFTIVVEYLDVLL